MSDFSDGIAGLADELAGEFGAAATYTEPGGLTQSVTIRVLPSSDDEVDGERGRAVRSTCRAVFDRVVISDPKQGSIVVVDSVEWAVDVVENRSGTFATVRMNRLDTLRTERQGFRRKYGQ